MFIICLAILVPKPNLPFDISFERREEGNTIFGKTQICRSRKIHQQHKYISRSGANRQITITMMSWAAPQLLLLLLAGLCQGGPLPSTWHLPSSWPPLPSLQLLPANLSDCRSSDFCHQGDCVLLPDLRVSCHCWPGQVDSQQGLCTLQAKSQQTAFLLR